MTRGGGQDVLPRTHQPGQAVPFEGPGMLLRPRWAGDDDDDDDDDGHPGLYQWHSGNTWHKGKVGNKP